MRQGHAGLEGEDEGVTVIRLKPGQSAIVLDADGSVVETYIPHAGDDVEASRGSLIAALLAVMSEDELDALIEEVLFVDPEVEKS